MESKREKRGEEKEAKMKILVKIQYFAQFKEISSESRMECSTNPRLPKDTGTI